LQLDQIGYIQLTVTRSNGKDIRSILLLKIERQLVVQGPLQKPQIPYVDNSVAVRALGLRGSTPMRRPRGPERAPCPFALSLSATSRGLPSFPAIQIAIMIRVGASCPALTRTQFTVLIPIRAIEPPLAATDLAIVVAIDTIPVCGPRLSLCVAERPVIVRIDAPVAALSLANAAIIVAVQQIAMFLRGLTLAVAEHSIIIGVGAAITFLATADVAVVISVQPVEMFPVALAIRGLSGYRDRPSQQGAGQDRNQR